MAEKITNFHTHTMLCGHAEGTVNDYVSVAKKDGCAALGFSDHCPYPDDSETWPAIRMRASQAPEYIAAIRKAKKNSPFPIKAGFECEWDKAYKGWYKDELLGNFGADYLVLGPHWVTKGKEHIYALDIKDKETLNLYAKQNIKGIESGIFAFVAHPDLFMGEWKEWDEEAKSVSEAIIDAAISCGLPLEVNGLGMKRHTILTRLGERYQYPYLEFWQMAKEKGAKVVCNSDAHNPNDVIEWAMHARQFAKQLGLNVIDMF